MGVKKPSQTAGKIAVSEEQSEKLARQLADKPYDMPINEPRSATGSSLSATSENWKAVAISVSLPGALVEQLEDAVYANKRAKHGHKSVSAIIKHALEAQGYRVESSQQ